MYAELLALCPEWEALDGRGKIARTRCPWPSWKRLANASFLGRRNITWERSSRLMF